MNAGLFLSAGKAGKAPVFTDSSHPPPPLSLLLLLRLCFPPWIWYYRLICMRSVCVLFFPVACLCPLHHLAFFLLERGRVGG